MHGAEHWRGWSAQRETQLWGCESILRLQMSTKLRVCEKTAVIQKKEHLKRAHGTATEPHRAENIANLSTCWTKANI